LFQRKYRLGADATLPRMPEADALAAALRDRVSAARVVTDPLRRLAYGTDASFYRLIPQVVVIAENEADVLGTLAVCRQRRAPLTFRAAGTSLSGQAISDSVLLVLGDGWRGASIGPNAETVRLQAGVIGGHANRLLAAHGRKIGPDPASIDAAKVGGIAANNASGMCCGTRENSYHTLAGMRIILADGALLDTEDAASVAAFRASHAELLLGLTMLARRVQENTALAERICHKYRMKNTTGYGLNALVDFTDPLAILTHLMIGSEGTLGFISSVTYRTVPEHAHKATALILFDTLRDACEAVTALKPTPVAAVELMDRAALASVQDQKAVPEAVKTLGADAAALLVEVRGEHRDELAHHLHLARTALAGIPTATPIEFTDDAEHCAALWKVRKGTFPSVGSRRATGTTVIIEDVAFPVPRLADATLDLQKLLHAHGYTEAIIFGHALEGNLHFVFTQDFGSEAEIARYARFMDEVAQLVVGRYDGALKAEHGTGRNMAPYVTLEWGADGVALMREIKRLFDPEGLLNPGVILNDDAQAHLKHLKPLPAAHELVDKCIECGFCEPLCPSAGMTFTPRQRITSWREISHRARAGGDTTSLAPTYAYDALDTCAGCGLCATACPVGIETGKLVKAQRGEAFGALAHRVGRAVASNYGAVSVGVRAGLAGASLLHAAIGTRAMGAMTGGLRKLSGDRIPPWTPHTPRAARFTVPQATNQGDPLVYFPSCATRSMGPARGDPVTDSVPTVTDRVLRRAGFAPIYPENLGGLCCGQPFESKGLATTADEKSAELEAALRAASDGGRLPIVFDTSPCVYRMKRHVEGRLDVLDISEALRKLVLPRLAIRPIDETVAVHPVCSVRKQGLDGTLREVAAACAAHVVQPERVGCCGWAGDKGWTVPELNAHALRDLREAIPAGCDNGYSSSRTCEIGLAEHSGITYRSIVHLVDAASR
jgi:D-lactate dehydrogenase